MAYLLAALGGALGALVRWGIALGLPPSAGWPWATWLVNVSGCLLIGILLAVLPSRFPASAWPRPLLGVGVLGGYTTWSTFAVEVVELGRNGAWLLGAAYVGTSVAGGVAAVAVGLLAARAVLSPADSVPAGTGAGGEPT